MVGGGGGLHTLTLLTLLKLLHLLKLTRVVVQGGGGGGGSSSFSTLHHVHLLTLQHFQSPLLGLRGTGRGGGWWHVVVVGPFATAVHAVHVVHVVHSVHSIVFFGPGCGQGRTNARRQQCVVGLNALFSRQQSSPLATFRLLHAPPVHHHQRRHRPDQDGAVIRAHSFHHGHKRIVSNINVFQTVRGGSQSRNEI